MADEKNVQGAANGDGGQDESQTVQAGRNSVRANGKSGKSIRGLAVSSTRDGYRRAGREWTKEPITVPLSELSKEQRRLLEWDANIRVVEVDIPVTGQEEA